MKKITTLLGIITLVFYGVFIEKVSTMGIFEKMFGTKEGTSDSVAFENNLSEHRQHIDSLRKPAIRFEKEGKSGLSKIGGLPVSNKALQWPLWKEKPLSFLCQIDFRTIPKSEFTKNFPDDGLLYFFYDQEQETWGFNPKDKGSWKVIYINDRRDLKPKDAPAGLDKENIYKEKYIKLSEILTYPDLQDNRVDKLNLNETQSDEYFDLSMSVFEDQPSHHLFGYPSPVQGNDMDLESQLVSNGIYIGDATGYNNPKVKELESGRHEWILILQLDSDDDTGMMWGDAGMLYFWIRKEDLKNKNFDNVWMIFQCY